MSPFDMGTKQDVRYKIEDVRRATKLSLSFGPG